MSKFEEAKTTSRFAATTGANEEFPVSFGSRSEREQKLGISRLWRPTILPWYERRWCSSAARNSWYERRWCSSAARISNLVFFFFPGFCFGFSIANGVRWFRWPREVYVGCNEPPGKSQPRFRMQLGTCPKRAASVVSFLNGEHPSQYGGSTRCLVVSPLSR